MDEIELDEITITMIREKKPVRLFRWFGRNGYQIEEVFKGIYYVTRENHFLTQILVSKQLAKDNQKWLTLLSKDLDQADVKRTVTQIEALTEESDKRYGDSVLQVAVKENEEIFNKIKEEENMCKALTDLIEDAREEEKAKTEKERQRADAAETENRRLREEIERLKNNIK